MKNEIRLLAADMQIGDTQRVVCPFCGDRERTFSITRHENGLLYNCYRASCGSRGFTPEPGHDLPNRPPKPKVQPYRGELQVLGEDDFEYFSWHYDLCRDSVRDSVVDAIYRNEHDEYVLPVRNPVGRVRGYNVRQPWPGAPRKGREGAPKSKLWMHSEEPSMAWYTYPGIPRTLVVVEDQLSAMMASEQYECDAVALLGTHMNAERAREIASVRPEEVIIALDPDATDQAFAMARKWGLAWPKCLVAILDRDIKDGGTI